MEIICTFESFKSSRAEEGNKSDEGKPCKFFLDIKFQKVFICAWWWKTCLTVTIIIRVIALSQIQVVPQLKSVAYWSDFCYFKKRDSLFFFIGLQNFSCFIVERATLSLLHISPILINVVKHIFLSWSRKKIILSAAKCLS